MSGPMARLRSIGVSGMRWTAPIARPPSRGSTGRSAALFCRHLYDLRRMNLTAETKFSREVFGLLLLYLWLNRYAVR